MASVSTRPLHQQTFSLDHGAFAQVLATTANLLIIQDLDGVCMALVNDPLHRQIDLAYGDATRAFEGHFYVLTNGEHTGRRGVNRIIERAMGVAMGQAQGHYLPGLAAGGVQWQTRQGQVEHPGVSQAELTFLQQVPDRIRTTLRAFGEEILSQNPEFPLTLEDWIRHGEACVLDNIASPTGNLNTLAEVLGRDRATYRALQQRMAALMDTLLTEASHQGLGGSFFVHYAPNHGREATGAERIWWADDDASGTTDFQFMLRGGIKEAGVVALLNRYYGQHTGVYPLGQGFSARQAPQALADLLALVQDNFDPAQMPVLVGVGDTVTSQVDQEAGQTVAKRGGSDRAFLHLIQEIGRACDRPNLTVYVDSSGGQLLNRRPLQLVTEAGGQRVVAGPGDPRDTTDPLQLNVAFPGGHRQYCQVFQRAAQARQALTAGSPTSVPTP